MILTVNVSNSQILLGGYQDGARVFCASLHTDPSATADEYAVRMRSVLGLYEVDPRRLAGAILSCVVPSLLQPVRKALGLLYPGRLYVVGPGLKTGLQIRMDDPGQLGGELVCAAVAAKEQYPLPCVVVSLDTATTLLALDEDGVLRGGALVAGVRTGVDALCARAAQLPQVDLAVPACGVLGSGSVTCVQGGAVFGTASMIDGMVDRFARALGTGIASCVVTGELAPLIAPRCVHEVSVHEHLVLDGLYALYRRNTRS